MADGCCALELIGSRGGTVEHKMDTLCNATSTRSSWPLSKQTGASPVTSDVIGSGSAALVG